MTGLRPIVRKTGFTGIQEKSSGKRYDRQYAAVGLAFDAAYSDRENPDNNQQDKTSSG